MKQDQTINAAPSLVAPSSGGFLRGGVVGFFLGLLASYVCATPQEWVLIDCQEAARGTGRGLMVAAKGAP